MGIQVKIMEMVIQITISIILFLDREKELHNRRGILLEKTIVCAVIVGIFVLLISGNF